jgi:hypothetical protein
MFAWLSACDHNLEYSAMHEFAASKIRFFLTLFYARGVFYNNELLTMAFNLIQLFRS